MVTGREFVKLLAGLPSKMEHRSPYVHLDLSRKQGKKAYRDRDRPMNEWGYGQNIEQVGQTPDWVGRQEKLWR